MKHYLIVAIFAAAIFFGSTQLAVACSCVLPDPNKSLKASVSEAKSSATAIFVGKVVSVRYSEEKLNGIPMTMYAKLDVERSWKGPQTGSIEVETANICCICGFTFEEGKTYIIYSHSPDRQSLGVSSCSRTAVITGKSGDEKYLGKARKVIKTSK